MNAEAYRYQPLANPDTGDEMRLLKIHPGPANSVLRLQLFIVDRHTTTIEYDALSYMWGSDDNLQIAFIDDKLVSLRENLSSFLEHYRDTVPARHQDPYLWIDALCINQEDSWEKMSQVARMHSTYRGARSVLIWLGNTSRPILSPAQFEAFLEHCERTKSDTRAETSLAQLSTEVAGSLHPIEHHASQIIESPYWSRLWIIQEIKMAATASIICGSELLPLECMTTAATYFESGLFELDRHVSPEQVYLFRLATSELEANHTWADYVVGCQDHQCSELRDHVFGLMGLPDSPCDAGHRLLGEASLGDLMITVLEHSVDQHERRGEEYDALTIMHQLSTALSVSTSDTLTAADNGTADRDSFILAFDDVSELTPQCFLPLSQVQDLGYAPCRSDIWDWEFACQSMAMHTNGCGPYLCFDLKHASVRWYPESSSNGVDDMIVEPTIIHLQHWPLDPTLLIKARYWMTQKENKEVGRGLQGEREAQDLKQFRVSCSFLALTELYSAFRTLAGLP
ncbi:hypothetical protein LTR10_004998 [Elasticomyces elasticus]|nr:hypothetical protein LTR10_004998 [Elasticomyces elasticus]KAK4975741.1 hypothetical protein LTR42_003360 [Elasticomyces elasticus]